MGCQEAKKERSKSVRKAIAVIQEKRNFAWSRVVVMDMK